MIALNPDPATRTAHQAAAALANRRSRLRMRAARRGTLRPASAVAAGPPLREPSDISAPGGTHDSTFRGTIVVPHGGGVVTPREPTLSGKPRRASRAEVTPPVWGPFAESFRLADARDASGASFVLRPDSPLLADGRPNRCYPAHVVESFPAVTFRASLADAAAAAEHSTRTLARLAAEAAEAAEREALVADRRRSQTRERVRRHRARAKGAEAPAETFATADDWAAAHGIVLPVDEYRHAARAERSHRSRPAVPLHTGGRKLASGASALPL